MKCHSRCHTKSKQSSFEWPLVGFIAIIATLYFRQPLLPQSHALSTPSSSSSSSAPSTLRSLIQTHKSTGTAIALPGVHDALTARIYAETMTSSSPKAIFLSGFGVSASRLGMPDAGVISYSEMEDAAHHVISATRSKNKIIPVVVDGDTGHGGPANIRRTIHGLSRVGAAAITIEDQSYPKKCCYASGNDVRVVSREEATSRIRFTLEAREEYHNLYQRGRSNDDRVLIIARTDCRAALGFDEVIRRCKEFEAMGADVVYAENLKNRDEYLTLRSELGVDTPMMLAQVQNRGEDVDRDLFTVEEVGNMGYSLALFGVTALQAAVRAIQESAVAFYGGHGGVLRGEKARSMLADFSELKRVVGFDELDEFESLFGS